MSQNIEIQDAAQYGKAILKNLSARLTNKYGAGWSVDTLENCRKFYQVYSISSDSQTKSKTPSRKSDNYSLDVIKSTWKRFTKSAKELEKEFERRYGK